MSIAEAWASSRPVFVRLPGTNGGYTENPIADWLTQYWDELLVGTLGKLRDIPARQLNPLTADEDWLDFLAPLTGWDSKYWDKNYPIAGKRQLLANSFVGASIWKNKGSADVLSFVLAQAGIQNRVMVRGDFLVGISEVGDPIGTLEWEYAILLPTAYESTDKERAARRINKLFGPAWCEAFWVYDDAPFIITELLADDEGRAIADENDSILDVSNG
jgi:hypothetical protein